MKLKICDSCYKERPIWKRYKGKKYCLYCWNKINHNKIKIKSVSKNKSKLDNIYLQLRRVYLTIHPNCEAHIPNICMGVASDIHHKKGRNKYYLVTSTWLAVCRKCHNWIEEHPKMAKDMGFSKNLN